MNHNSNTTMICKTKNQKKIEMENTIEMENAERRAWICCDALILRAEISFLVRCSEFKSDMCSITVKSYQPSW